MSLSVLRVSNLCCKGLGSNCRRLPHSLQQQSLRFARTSRVGIGIKPGVTLRERLLGPTTGKPFVYGTYALAGGSIVGIGALCFYGLGLGKGASAMDNSVLWPQYVRDRVHTTYTYLGASLGITAASAVAISRHPAMLRMVSGGGLMTLIGSLAAVIGTGMLVRSIPYSHTDNGLKHAAWLLHTAVLGGVLAPMCYLGGPAIIRAAWYTAGVVGGLSAIAMCAPSDKFLFMGAPLAMGFGVVFVSTIGTWFLPPTSALGAGVWSIAIYGGLLVMSGFLLYDTQRVIHKAEHYPTYGVPAPFDPVNAQISLYMDILNIFIRIAMLTGGNKRK